jgi:hypothetical protein
VDEDVEVAVDEDVDVDEDVAVDEEVEVAVDEDEDVDVDEDVEVAVAVALGRVAVVLGRVTVVLGRVTVELGRVEVALGGTIVPFELVEFSLVDGDGEELGDIVDVLLTSSDLTDAIDVAVAVCDIDTINDEAALADEVIVGLAVVEIELNVVAAAEAVADEEAIAVLLGVTVAEPE